MLAPRFISMFDLAGNAMREGRDTQTGGAWSCESDRKGE